MSASTSSSPRGARHRARGAGLEGLLIAALASSAAADTVFNNTVPDDTAFRGAAGPGVREESFELSAIDPVTLIGFDRQFDHFRLQSPSGRVTTDLVSESHPTDGAVYFLTQAPITFSFNQAVTAFGLTFTDFLDFGGGAGAVSYATSSGGSGTVATALRPQGEERFFGVFDAAGFTSITFTNTLAGDGMGIDQVLVNPEPTSLALFALGVLGVAVRRRLSAPHGRA